MNIGSLVAAIPALVDDIICRLDWVAVVSLAANQELYFCESSDASTLLLI